MSIHFVMVAPGVQISLTQECIGLHEGNTQYYSGSLQR